MITLQRGLSNWTRLAVIAALALVALGAVPPAPSIAVDPHVLTLVDQAGDPLANYPADHPTEPRNLVYKYRCGGSWAPTTPFQTDANGRFTVTPVCADDSWDSKVTVTLNQTSKEQNVVTGSSTFQAAKVRANLLKGCSPDGIAGGTVAQGGGYWYTHGDTGSSGTVAFFAFPGNNVEVRMAYNHNTQTKTEPVSAGVNDIDFQATAVTTSYPEDIRSNKGGSWWFFTKPTMYLLPGAYNFYFWNGTAWDGPESVTVSGCSQELVGPATGDTTPPTASPTQSPAANGAGWNNTNVTVSWHWSDEAGGSGIDNGNCTTSSDSTGQGSAITLNATCKDLAGNTGTAEYTVKVDRTKPTIVASPDRGPNGAGWYKDDVTVSFACDDVLSGIPANACPADQTLDTEGVAVTSIAETVSDKAGNVSDASNVVTVNIDKTKPSVSLVGGPADGGSYVFGSVPAAPTCQADDALSGIASCEISGYGQGVGSHEVTATAKDLAGNTATEKAAYTVTGWALEGFFKPINMDGVLNRVKAGSTVPLKFRVFAGSTELTDPAVVESLQAQRRECSAIDDDTAEIPDELTETGETSLRYADGQFIYNWKTAKAKAGQCFVVKVSTDDGSFIKAFFELK